MTTDTHQGDDMSELTPKVFFEEQIAAGLQADPSRAREVNAIFQFKISGDNGGDWAVDLTTPEVVAGDKDGAQVTIHMEATDFMDMVEGRLPGPQAFMTGKLRVEGDIALAMKLQDIFAMNQV